MRLLDKLKAGHAWPAVDAGLFPGGRGAGEAAGAVDVLHDG